MDRILLYLSLLDLWLLVAVSVGLPGMWPRNCVSLVRTPDHSRREALIHIHFFRLNHHAIPTVSAAMKMVMFRNAFGDFNHGRWTKFIP